MSDTQPAGTSDDLSAKPEIKKAVDYLLADDGHNLVFEIFVATRQRLDRIGADDGSAQACMPFHYPHIAPIIMKKFPPGATEGSIKKFLDGVDSFLRLIYERDEATLIARFDADDCVITAEFVNRYYNIKERTERVMGEIAGLSLGPAGS